MISYIAISSEESEELEAVKNGTPIWRNDWDSAKGKWITIRQYTKDGYLYRSVLALDYVPFDEYKKSDKHSFIILEA